MKNRDVSEYTDIIHLNSDTDIGEWITNNNDTILNAVYNKLELFLEKKLQDEILVRLIIDGYKEHGGKKYSVENVIDIFLVESDLTELSDRLLAYLLKNEEYEKCAKITKLKEKYKI